jgi:hypothetical protein
MNESKLEHVEDEDGNLYWRVAEGAFTEDRVAERNCIGDSVHKKDISNSFIQIMAKLIFNCEKVKNKLMGKLIFPKKFLIENMIDPLQREIELLKNTDGFISYDELELEDENKKYIESLIVSRRIS